MTNKMQRLTVNAITLARLPFVLLFMILAVFHAQVPAHEGINVSDVTAFAATFSLIIASLTDLYDGKLARKWKVVSKFGAMADPLMDKVFYLVVFPTLLWIVGHQGGQSSHALLLLTLTVVNILRDQWVTFLRSVASTFNAYCGAMWIGKFRTAFTFPASILIYLWICFHPAFLPASAIYSLEGFLILVTCWSIFSYTKAYFPYIKKSLE